MGGGGGMSVKDVSDSSVTMYGMMQILCQSHKVEEDRSKVISETGCLA